MPFIASLQFDIPSTNLLPMKEEIMPTIHYLTSRNGKLEWVSIKKFPRRCFNEMKTLDQSYISTSIIATPAHSTRSRVKEEFGSKEGHAIDSEYDLYDLYDKSYYMNLCRQFTKRRIKDKAKLKYKRMKIKLLKHQLKELRSTIGA